MACGDIADDGDPAYDQALFVAQGRIKTIEEAAAPCLCYGKDY